MSDRNAIVITTIFEATQALRDMSAKVGANGWELIVVGDLKTPADFHLKNANYFSLTAQREAGFKLSPLCPENHYTRKNLGYLIAMRKGCNVIIETDDDNIPGNDFWSARTPVRNAREIGGDGWHNVYKDFSDQNLWPRGFPLEELNAQKRSPRYSESRALESPIQQGLADGNPDVDAVFRMTAHLPVNFNPVEIPVVTSKGVWCPFNSQNTTWFRQAFPLLYLPSFCSFRMTDIWRSFVAQRVAWECGWGILFHSATVYQDRNEHNLLKDFEQEIPGYLHNARIAALLEKLPLKPGVQNIPENMVACYRQLVDKKIIDDARELTLLDAWLTDAHEAVAG